MQIYFYCSCSESQILYETMLSYLLHWMYSVIELQFLNFWNKSSLVFETEVKQHTGTTKLIHLSIYNPNWKRYRYPVCLHLCASLKLLGDLKSSCNITTSQPTKNSPKEIKQSKINYLKNLDLLGVFWGWGAGEEWKEK